MRKTTTHTASYTYAHKQNTNYWKCDSLNSSPASLPASQPTSLNDEILSTNWMWIRRVNAQNVHHSRSVLKWRLLFCVRTFCYDQWKMNQTHTHTRWYSNSGTVKYCKLNFFILGNYYCFGFAPFVDLKKMSMNRIKFISNGGDADWKIGNLE